MNTFSEASRRYRNFKSRGFIALEGNITGRDVYQAFVQEVAAEKRGETFNNPWGREAYERRYNTELDYEDTRTYEDVVEEHLREQYAEVVQEYRERLQSIIEGTNDFSEMAQRYPEMVPVSLDDLETIDNLTDMISYADSLKKANLVLMRSTRGKRRNRRTESSDMESFYDEFTDEIAELVIDMQVSKIEYDE